jgi:hypothetical protein
MVVKSRYETVVAQFEQVIWWLSVEQVWRLLEEHGCSIDCRIS